MATGKQYSVMRKAGVETPYAGADGAPDEAGEADFLRLMVERYDAAIDLERENRQNALEDLKFVTGDQWPEQVVQDRQEDHRPILTVNRMPQFVRQVVGDIRVNKPAIRVHPVDDKADPKMAKVLAGIIRHIEYSSQAENAYTSAASAAAACGQGFFRICTDWAGDDTFDQEIQIKPINNPLAVVYDPASIKYDRSDARYCFVIDEMSHADFEAQFPDHVISDFESAQESDYVHGWITDDKVKVVEYWCKKYTTRKLGLTATGDTLDLTEVDEDMLDGIEIVRRRDAEVCTVECYLASGSAILEGPTQWPGARIPIVPVWGEEYWVGEKCVRTSVIRFSKDSQRMYNYHMSAAVESVSLAPKAPWVVTIDQVKGLERFWNNANTKNLPYLLYNPDPQAGGPPQRQQPPAMPSAMLQLAAISQDDMKATTGIYDAGLGARSNETSGAAIRARQQEGDISTYSFIDNLHRSIECAGRILVDLIPKIYDGARAVRILGEDNDEKVVQVNQMQQGEAPDGAVFQYLQNDLSVGKYDVTVETGPSFSTRRAEAADSMMTFINAVPQAAAAAGDLIAENMDWPGAEKIAERLRRIAVMNGIAEPREGDAPPAPNPEAEAKKMEMQADMMERAAEMRKTEAEVNQIKLENAQKALELAMQNNSMQQLIAGAVQKALVDFTSQMGSQPQGPAAPNVPPRSA